MKVTTKTVTTVVSDDEKDFPELAKKSVTMDNLRKEGSFDAVVVDVNYDVGITVVKKDDKNRLVICINKKEMSRNPYLKTEEMYAGVFYRIVKAIQRGHITRDDAEFIQPGCTEPRLGGFIDADRCGWGA